MSDYLHFALRGPSKSGKTKVWAVESKKDRSLLGFVKWHGPWRKYILQPATYTIFDTSCLTEIATFIQERMGERSA